LKSGSIHARATSRAPFFVALDDQVERGGIDIALLGEDGFERAHPQLDVAELGMLVVMIVIGHRQTSGRERRLA
jgi:hypothetical protein